MFSEVVITRIQIQQYSPHKQKLSTNYGHGEWQTSVRAPRASRSERGAAEGAEPELRVDRAAARATPGLLGQQRRARLGAEGTRRKEAALAAEVGGVLPGPPPDGDEEELERLLRLHQVRRAAAPQAPPRRLLEHPPGALLHAAHEEEEHLHRIPIDPSSIRWCDSRQ
jgi:hypothetical protein